MKPFKIGQRLYYYNVLKHKICYKKADIDYSILKDVDNFSHSKKELLEWLKKTYKTGDVFVGDWVWSKSEKDVVIASDFPEDYDRLATNEEKLENGFKKDLFFFIGAIWEYTNNCQVNETDAKKYKRLIEVFSFLFLYQYHLKIPVREDGTCDLNQLSNYLEKIYEVVIPE